MNDHTFIPPRLAEIAADFGAASREEKLELLLEFSDQLPPLPPELRDHRGMEQVHECMSPVFVIAQRDGERIVYHIDVPPEAPTIRGFAAILREDERLNPRAGAGRVERFHPADGIASGAEPAAVERDRRAAGLYEAAGLAPARARTGGDGLDAGVAQGLGNGVEDHRRAATIGNAEPVEQCAAVDVR